MNLDSPADTRVLVMGVGRSGTTALYQLLQYVLEDRFPGGVDYVYEPFLWDRETFNRPYSQLTDEFRNADSISIEGIYHHKQLPMLVGYDSVIKPSSKEWVAQTLTPASDKGCYLAKFIRANGRIQLIRDLAPDAKIIFVIRNPVDVLNSAAQLFSFYGTPFHQSDFERFETEVKSRYQASIEPDSEQLERIEAEYAYWYYSNLAFLEYTTAHPQNIMTIAYEAFVKNRPQLVRRICEFLDIEFQSEFVDASKKKGGSVRSKVRALSEEEFLFLKGKLSAYEDLLKLVNKPPSRPISELVRVRQRSERLQTPFVSQQLNSFVANIELQQKIEELQNLGQKLKQAQNELIHIQSSKRFRLINRLLVPFDWLMSRLRR